MFKLINTQEYIALLRGAGKLNTLQYDSDELEMFDGLRKLYLKYCKEAAYHYYYPKLDVNKEVAPYLIDVIKFCNEYGVKCEYKKLNKEVHMSGDYCDFTYNGVLITPIIDLMPGKKEFKYK